MTKHLIISTKIPLHDDEFERAGQLLAAKALKVDFQAAVDNHFAGLEHTSVPTVTHEIHDSAALVAKAPRKPRVAKTLPVAEVKPPLGKATAVEPAKAA